MTYGEFVALNGLVDQKERQMQLFWCALENYSEKSQKDSLPEGRTCREEEAKRKTRDF